MLHRPLDDAAPVVLTSALFLLSPDAFRVAEIGRWRGRCRGIVLACPTHGLSVGYRDIDLDAASSTRLRCWVVDLPDGRWFAAETEIARKGTETHWARDAADLVTTLGRARARAW